jgi:hypothetical protein
VVCNRSSLGQLVLLKRRRVVVKEYPKILGAGEITKLKLPCVAFYKYDGSNLRFEWNKKQGWYKFGTRRHLFDRSCPEYGPSIPIFERKYAEPLEKIFREHKKYRKTDSVMVYAEYCGPHSFAGWHDPKFLGVESNPLDLILFDVAPYKQCFVSPPEFVDVFGHLDIAKVIYEGKFTEEFVQDVRNGKYPVQEGVIAKGGERHGLWYRKVKTLAYLQRLKEVFGVGGWEQYWE